jgi:hypothetical protein
MAHFAHVDDNNFVVDVQVVDNDSLSLESDATQAEEEAAGIAYLIEVHGELDEGHQWVQTSYNDNFRTRYAGIGYTWDADREAFLFPKPYPSWVLDENNAWVAPVPVPTDSTKDWAWDETAGEYVEIDPFSEIPEEERNYES